MIDMCQYRFLRPLTARARYNYSLAQEIVRRSIKNNFILIDENLNFRFIRQVHIFGTLYIYETNNEYMQGI